MLPRWLKAKANRGKFETMGQSLIEVTGRGKGSETEIVTWNSYNCYLEWTRNLTLMALEWTNEKSVTKNVQILENEALNGKKLKNWDRNSVRPHVTLSVNPQGFIPQFKTFNSSS